MVKNIEKYLITLGRIYDNDKEIINIVVYEFNGEIPINNGKPVGNFYIHDKIFECHFTEKEIEYFLSFP